MALFSEYQTEGTGNGPETVVMHFGEVTDYRAGSSLTLRSDDGVSQSYLLGPGTIGGSSKLRTGDMVRVVARKSDHLVTLLMASGR